MAPNALTTPAPGHESADPILSAIAAREVGNAAFAAIPSWDYARHGGEDAVIERPYLAPQRVLDGWALPAKTRSGAIAALKLAQDEIQAFGESPAANAMIKAALGYLEAH